MRIIYLHQYFNTPSMSGGTRSYEIGRRLVAAGHTVEMVTSWRESCDQQGWFITDEAGIRVHWLPIPYSNHMSYRARISAFVKFSIEAARRAASLPADIVFATSTPLTIALPAVYAASRQRIPMVFEVRDLWPKLPIAIGAIRNPLICWAAKRLESFAYANAVRVIALSPGMAEGVAQSGYPAEKIKIVPNSADLELFQRNAACGQALRQELGIPDHKILVGYMGTFGRINGVSYLIEVATALKNDPRFMFLLVGDGQEKTQLVEKARNNGVLNKNLLILAQVPKIEMPMVLSAVDIATSTFISLPEMEANSANKFFDALSAGCCIAINYGGWQAELLEETHAGIRLDRDPSKAAQQLKMLADEPNRIRSAGLKARQLAEDRFSRDLLTEQVKQVLIEVLNETNYSARNL